MRSEEDVNAAVLAKSTNILFKKYIYVGLEYEHPLQEVHIYIYIYLFLDLSTAAYVGS